MDHIRLKEYRLRAGLTVDQAAERIGVVFTTLYRWEAGENTPSMSKLEKIREVYRLKQFEVMDLLKNSSKKEAS